MADPCRGRSTIFLIDTDIALYSIRQTRHVREAFLATDAALLVTSSLVYSELLQGIDDRPNPVIERRLIEDFIAGVAAMPYDADAARCYGRIVTSLGFSRRHALDRMIAAHAISLDATLVTNNLADFDGIDGLQLANWAA